MSHAVHDAVIEGLVHRFGLKPNERGVNLTPAAARFFTGSSYGQDLYAVERFVPVGFIEQVEWMSRGFRAVWVHVLARAILTYCEGDLDLTVDGTDEVFAERLRTAAEYYRRR